MKARRVAFPGPGRVEIEEQELPEPGPGQVLLRTMVSLISTGTELTLLSGGHPVGSFWESYGCFPVYPGFGQVSEVVARGPGVADLPPGSRVLASAGHVSAALVAADRLTPLPAEVYPAEAVFHTIAAGVIGAFRLGQVGLGDSVTVVGLGLLGQLAVRLARAAGARPIVAVDLSRERLDLAIMGGASVALAPQSVDLVSEVGRATRGRMADVVLEMTGSADAIPTALRLVRPQGTYVQVGCPRGKTELDFHEAVLLPGLRVVGAHFGDVGDARERRRHTELFLDLLQDCSLEVASLITHRYSWRDAPAAYEMLAENRAHALGVLIDWSDEEVG